MNLPDSRQKHSARERIGNRKRPIRLLLADDHPISRIGVRFCLATCPDLKIVGEAGDGDEAVRKAHELLPDIILMDVEMPLMDGLAATESLRQQLPQIKVLIVSMHNSAGYILRIVQSGAWGCIFKDSLANELVKAIETIHADKTYFSEDVARMALNEMVRQATEEPKSLPLTNREQEVCTWVAKGSSSKEIAQVLGIGTRTVETHRANIMRKLNIHTVSGLTKFAASKGLIFL